MKRAKTEGREMINGIGGVFIFSENPEALANWYSETLGIKFEHIENENNENENGNTHYTVFWSRDDEHTERRFDTTFAIMKAKISFPEEQNNQKQKDMYGDRKVMINLRIDDMEQLWSHLKEHQIKVLDSVDEGYGIFSWIHDPDGNRIELYQPVRDDY